MRAHAPSRWVGSIQAHLLARDSIIERFMRKARAKCVNDDFSDVLAGGCKFGRHLPRVSGRGGEHVFAVLARRLFLSDWKVAR